jgi:fumarate reductase subunit C
MELQHLKTRKLKTAMFYDLIELVTGLILVGFLWTHMLFVASILIDAEIYNKLSEFLDKYYISYTGIPLIVVTFFVHFLVTSRRIPARFQEQKIIWYHSKVIGHMDTWTWVFQIITGMAILVLGSIHMWIIITGWPIEATVSALRIQSGLFWFYIILLLLGEYHAGFGLYRQFVKWGWLPRKPIGIVLKLITLVIVVLGFLALFAFLRLGGA